MRHMTKRLTGVKRRGSNCGMEKIKEAILKEMAKQIQSTES